MLSDKLRRKRRIFVLLSIGIFMLEVGIALFVRDSFVRPYGGDVLVTLLLCCIADSIAVGRFKPLPLVVFLFSLLVEIGQYFDYAELLGLSMYKIFRVILGSTFSLTDILCYAVGCVLFVVIATLVNKRLEH